MLCSNVPYPYHPHTQLACVQTPLTSGKKGRGGGKGMYTGYIQYAISPKRTHKIFVRLFRQKALQEIVTVTH